MEHFLAIVTAILITDGKAEEEGRSLVGDKKLVLTLRSVGDRA